MFEKSIDNIKTFKHVRNTTMKDSDNIIKNNLLLRKEALVWCNEYYDKDNYILLKVFKRDLSETYNVLIDKSDFNKVSQGQWHVNICRKNTHLKNIINILYSKRNPKTTYNIHQWILGTKHKNLVVDHIDMNRLDNKRQNLRIVNSSINSRNQPKKGYNYDKPTGKYLARIRPYGKNLINIGRYSTKLEAETMYLKAIIVLGGDKISTYHKDRIEELNVTLTKEDMNNKYLKKVYNITNNINEKITNSRFNYIVPVDKASNQFVL